MHNDIRLYIGEEQIDWRTTPEVLYNYTIDDLNNPTIVKNSFSKEVEINGTPNNNRILGQFWSLERYQKFGGGNMVGPFYNPSQKVPFKLFVNNELYESGYVKLDEITRNGENIVYKLTLYGGLGEFFYNLTYDGQGNQKTLASLDYMESGNSDAEFDTIINKETISDAWEHMGTEGDKWSYINFAPEYNGLPDNFGSDKAIINFNNMTPPIATAVTEDNVTYTPKRGFSLVDLGDKRTEWEVRDMRSYLQRPVLRMKRIIEAVSNPANNGGYTVNLDSDFFNANNPYYYNTWMTLPMVTELEYDNKTETTSVTVTMGTKTGQYFPINVSTEEPLYTASSLILQLGLNVDSIYSTATTLYLNNKWEDYYGLFNMNWTRSYDSGAMFLQLVGYDAFGNVVAGSDINFCTSEAVQEVTYQSFSTYVPVYNANFVTNIGKFVRTSYGHYQWCNLDGTQSVLRFNVSDSSTPIATMALRVTNYGNLYSELDTTTFGRTSPNPARVGSLNALPNLMASKLTITNNGTFTNTMVTKKLLLSTEGTPAEYLLSYAKHFGLYFEKDLNSKTINILTRSNYYKVNEDAVDISKLIDYSKEMKITPLTFTTKWYDFKLDQVEGEYQKEYKNTTSVDYGIQRVNTGYDFDADNNDLLEGNQFKCAIEGLEKSQLFVKPEEGFPIGICNIECKYTLYNGTSSITRSMPWIDTTDAEGINSDYKYYDQFSKVQFHSKENKGEDGSNVLLLYTGDFDDFDDVPYYITDDNDIMFALNNGEACWWLNNSASGVSGDTIGIEVESLPRFERYYILDSAINQSLDFGEPRQTYVPDLKSSPKSTIYHNYWRKYIEDMYDVNTRVLTCYVNINEKINPSWLKRFYWFENGIWRLNRVIDWNMCDNKPTKMEFVKVQDIDNYKLTPTTDYGHIEITTTASTMPSSGGVFTFNITVSDGGAWYIDYDTNYMTSQYDSGIGDMTNIQMTVSANTGTSRNLIVRAYADDSGSITVVQDAAEDPPTPTAETRYRIDSFYANPLQLPASASGVSNKYQITCTVSYSTDSGVTWNNYTGTETETKPFFQMTNSHYGVGNNDGAASGSWVYLDYSGTAVGTAWAYAKEVNTGTTVKTGTSMVQYGSASDYLTLSHSASSETPYITVSPTTVNHNYTSGSTTLTVTSNIGWAVSSSTAWLTATKNGNNISVSFTENQSLNSRAGVITVYSGSTSATCTVSQSATTNVSYRITSLSVTPNVLNASASGVNDKCQIEAYVQYSIDSGSTWHNYTGSEGTTKPYVVIDDDDHFDLCNASEVSQGGSMELVYSGSNRGMAWVYPKAAITTTTAKECDITLSYGGQTSSTTLTHQGTSIELYIVEDFIEHNHTSGRTVLNVVSNVDWSCSGNTDWMTVTKSGSTIVCTYPQNPMTSSRATTVSVYYGGQVYDTCLIQQLGDYVFSAVTTTTPVVGAPETSFTVRVKSLQSGTAIPIDEDNITIGSGTFVPTFSAVTSAGTGTYDVTFSCSANTSVDAKTCVITFTQPYSLRTLYFSVTQNGRQAEAIDFCEITATSAGTQYRVTLTNTHPTSSITMNWSYRFTSGGSAHTEFGVTSVPANMSSIAASGSLEDGHPVWGSEKIRSASFDDI